MKPFWISICTVCVLIVAGVGFALSGLYNISATVPHLSPTFMFLEAARERSIAHHSKTVELPALDNAELARNGSIHFDETCRKCHGAPGLQQEEFAEGLYPAPPSLETATDELSPAEIFWVIENGLKMTGMPAFGINHEREEIAGMTAFIEALPELDAAGYRQFIDEAKTLYSGEHHHDLGEVSPETSTSDTQGHIDEDEDHHH